MKTNGLKKILIASAFLLASGCAQKQRILTHQSWWNTPSGEGTYFYLTYWEGSCQAVLGCSNEESKVRRCLVNKDNTIACDDQQGVDDALNPQKKKK